MLPESATVPNMDGEGGTSPSKALLTLGIAATVVGAFVLRARSSVATGAVASAPSASSAAQAAAEASSRVAEEFAALGQAYKTAANKMTFPHAVNRYARWTPEEVAILRDSTLTAVDKALKLGRTFDSVMAKSIRIGASSKSP